MADLTFTVTDSNVKTEMTKVWEMANKGLKSGESVIVTLGREGTSSLQDKCFHGMIGDMVKQVGLGHDKDVWKSLLISGFAKEKHEMGEPLRYGNRWVMSLCGTYMLCVRPSIKTFNKIDGSEFIEYLFAKGSEYGVQFDDRTLSDYEKSKE